MAKFVMTVDADGTIRTEIQDAPGEACLGHIDTARRLSPGALVVESRATEQFARTSVEQQSRITEGVQGYDA
ncbi:hypothetical protein [Agrococcus lahaulensis]|uniref:hypothetical protein n=1 Tax=Agrococcus lahaulensis TaxID=341722 RepID=UPI000554FC9A|nr:hypothetical protein [Agrococcus lahaulensis]